MKETANNPPTISISEEAQETTRQAIEKAFGSLTEHVKQIGENFTQFDKRRQEMRRRMQNGARRTSGRIV